jgi:cell division protein FtsW
VTTVARLWQRHGAAREEMTHEEQMLRTATLIQLAFGAVMVYSASSGTSLLSHDGDSSQYLKRYLVSAALGLLALRFFARHGVEVARRATPFVMVAAFAGLLLVLVPGFGIEANGSRRWLGAGPLQVQPSEIGKLALVLYAATLLASQPQRVRSLYGVRPLLVVAGAMALLIVAQPDLGTTMVIMFAVFALLAAGGVSLRNLGILAGVLVGLALIAAVLEPYRRERLTSFINPWSDPEGSGFQSVQAMIAIGSGGFFGVGLGESVQKLFYLPEAHTDMILAVIGEELGFTGIGVVLFLYGMIAYAGLRAARTARDHYAKLLAAGITSVILIQAVVNFFAVLGLLPLTGVPLPFISYGNSNLIVLLSGMGILINVAHTGGARARKPKLKVIEGKGRSEPRAIRRTDAKSRDSGRRDGRARRPGAGGRRRAAG